jgi:hypothetical protein
LTSASFSIAAVQQISTAKPQVHIVNKQIITTITPAIVGDHADISLIDILRCEEQRLNTI